MQAILTQIQDNTIGEDELHKTLITLFEKMYSVRKVLEVDSDNVKGALDVAA